jgi:methylated-DNA-[protein]-cysteine S-methyltransferase
MGGMSEDVAVGGLDTPVGRISVAVTRDGLAAVGWGRRLGVGRLPVVDDGDRLAPVLGQLAEYFAGGRRHFDLPIDWRHVTGSASGVVLRTLHQTVGYGSSVTYGELATRSGTGVPARAIGGIMGANPIPIVVPCHRVLASDGLGGYSGGSGRNGLEVKRWLLTLEGVLPPTFDWSPAGLAGA